jgi:hypothetical protein
VSIPTRRAADRHQPAGAGPRCRLPRGTDAGARTVIVAVKPYVSTVRGPSKGPGVVGLRPSLIEVGRGSLAKTVGASSGGRRRVAVPVGHRCGLWPSISGRPSRPLRRRWRDSAVCRSSRGQAEHADRFGCFVGRRATVGTRNAPLRKRVMHLSPVSGATSGQTGFVCLGRCGATWGTSSGMRTARAWGEPTS